MTKKTEQKEKFIKNPRARAKRREVSKLNQTEQVLLTINQKRDSGMGEKETLLKKEIKEMIIKENLETEITTSKDIYEILRNIYNLRGKEDSHKEMFYCIGLNSKNRVLYIDLVALGTINQCNPPLRECLRLALVRNASSLIITHNHPSEDKSPSQEDRRFTEEINSACKLIQIKFLDHIIYTNIGYYSFADNGEIS